VRFVALALGVATGVGGFWLVHGVCFLGVIALAASLARKLRGTVAATLVSTFIVCLMAVGRFSAGTGQFGLIYRATLPPWQSPWRPQSL
jgi:hypothetical protein